MFNQLWSIARNTFVESIRRPIYMVLLMTGMAMIWLSLIIAAYTMGEDNKMMTDMAMSSVMLVSLALAFFTAPHVLSEEIEHQTVMTVVSKPVSRTLFILGKYLGVVLAQTMAFWIMICGVFLMVRHKVMATASDPFDGPVILGTVLSVIFAVGIAGVGNYLYRWIFTSTFCYLFGVFHTVAWLLVLIISKKWQFQSITTEFLANDAYLVQLMLALLLVYEIMLVLTALAIATATRVGWLLTLVICAGVTVLGVMSEYFRFLLERWYESQTHVTWWMTALYGAGYGLHLVVPNLQLFWQTDALTQGAMADLLAKSSHRLFLHIASLTAYSVLYITAMLALAVALFQRREVG